MTTEQRLQRSGEPLAGYRIVEFASVGLGPFTAMLLAEHPHLRSRGTYVEIEGVVQPAPAPRFSRTPSAVRAPPACNPTPVGNILAQWTKDRPCVPDEAQR